MNLVQECNVTLKWMMLHTAPLSPSNGIHIMICKLCSTGTYTFMNKNVIEWMINNTLIFLRRRVEQKMSSVSGFGYYRDRIWTGRLCFCPFTEHVSVRVSPSHNTQKIAGESWNEMGKCKRRNQDATSGAFWNIWKQS